MDIAKMLQQAQRMQQDLQSVQAGLSDKVVEGTAGGGRVTVEASAAGEVLTLKIDPAVVDPTDVEFLQDLILTAVRNALDNAKALAGEEMRRVTGGMGLPPGLGF